jgi:protein-S-isoprenylcysteine O-methyltransferase Ste14
MPKKTIALIRSVALAAPASAMYLVVAPMVCRYLDGRIGFTDWDSPWLAISGALLLVPGIGLAVWTLTLFSVKGQGTPNPLMPPRRLVQAGPYRYSRNPMMLGGWLAGFGLGLVLHSPSYLLFCGAIVAAGMIYVIAFEERSLIRRFGTEYLEYRRCTPRWVRFHCA